MKTRSLALVLACGLAASMVLSPLSSGAQVMSGTVGLLGFGPGWYSGVTRVTQVIVEWAGVQEIANIALTSAMRGGLAGAVILGMVLAEPAFNSGVDAIRTYLSSLSWSVSGGVLSKSGGPAVGGPDMFVPGSAEAMNFAAVEAYGNSTWGSIGIGYSVYNSYSAATTAMSAAYTACGGYSYCAENSSYSSGDVTCAFMGTLNHSTGNTVSEEGYCGPTVAGTGVETNNNQPPPPVAVTEAALDTQIQTDIGNGVAKALAAADEAEQILNWGIPGAVANASATPKVADGIAVATGTVIDETIPATPTTGATSAAQEAANVAVANLPSGGAITSAPPAAGTSSSTAAQEPYTDPSFAGSLSTVPWATPSDFGARWSTFASGVQSTGLFGLWGNAFGSPGSGGSSTYTFNAGSLGTHTYDFSSWGSTVFGLLSGLVQISCGLVGIKIACLSGSGG